MDSVDEARRLRETSDNLRNRAISTAMKIEEGLVDESSFHSVYVTSIIQGAREKTATIHVW